MKIGVIGCGTVGRALTRAYLEFVDAVLVYDVDDRLRTHHLHEVVCDTDLTFVCVPEAAVDDVFKHFGGLLHDRNFVLKSTVPVGTTRRLAETYGLTNLVHSPEFLTARCAETDARIPAVNVIGNPDGRAESTDRALARLYESRFPGTRTLCMTSDESEAAKLCLNAWFAMKVSAFNELYSFCEQMGCNWETVRRVILADGRTSAHHTMVPGPDGKRGFGGACLPKDLQQFIAQHSDAVIANAVRARNNEVDR